MGKQSPNEWMVETRGLSKQFKRPGNDPILAVNSVDLQIRRGEIFSLLGPNGAGKTTTISMMCGLLRPTSGDAFIGGHSITMEPLAAKSILGVVPQEIALYHELSARQNLEFFGKLQGKRGSELAALVDEVLEFVDLTDRQKDKVETFSGGMKRRVNLAVGLLHRPQLLFLDEPTVGIDPQNRRRLLDLIRRLRDEMNITILYSSHLMEEVQELSDRVAIMDKGEIITLGTVRELIQSLGEEDRLMLTVGEQPVSAALLERLQEIAGPPESAKVEHRRPTPGEGKGPEHPDGAIVVLAPQGRRALPRLLNTLNEAGVEVQSIEIHEPDLEAVFLTMTGRALRD